MAYSESTAEAVVKASLLPSERYRCYIRNVDQSKTQNLLFFHETFTSLED